mmetsp:Transcript_85094/g.104346  ORF Transcript_85094/g.104346 Transcript_85094/m.104346 type:complete len:112 (+) Transcript_85094:35-370(+)
MSKPKLNLRCTHRGQIDDDQYKNILASFHYLDENEDEFVDRDCLSRVLWQKYSYPNIVTNNHLSDCGMSGFGTIYSIWNINGAEYRIEIITKLWFIQKRTKNRICTLLIKY